MDHADSMGATGRYGNGDMQWLTAAAGVQHQEMFPCVHFFSLKRACAYVCFARPSPRQAPLAPPTLLAHPPTPTPLPARSLVNTAAPNTLHLYQIWLNLPAAKKLAPPAYSMLWAENVGAVAGEGGATALIYVGELRGVRGCPAPPNSWAAAPAADLGVFVLRLPPGASFSLPAAAGGDATARTALVTRGGAGVEVDGAPAPALSRVALRGGGAAVFRNSAPAAAAAGGGEGGAAEVLLLQGAPIGEPVAQHGPFVMNTRAEIQRAFEDFEATQFGGWPHAEEEVVFPRAEGRFASRPGQGVERPPARGGAGEL